MNEQPIGVIDSGVGGLTVLAELEQWLPSEQFIYYGDLANAPYGGRPPADVQRLAWTAADALISLGAKAIVLACNTATSAAVGMLRQRLALPVIGMEPALKPATALTQSRHVIVLATALTLWEAKFAELLERTADGTLVTRVAAPELVSLVEQGVYEGDRMMSVLQDLLLPALSQRADVIVLGCTHFCFLAPAIQRAVGLRVRVIDGNAGTARQVRRVLEQHGLATSGGRGTILLTGSGDPAAVERHLSQFFDLARRQIAARQLNSETRR